MEHHGRFRRRKDFPADVLAEILPRLPPSARRRARLVCRLWRDVVNERTTEMQSRPKVLLWGIRSGVAYIVDDLSSSSTGTCRELWRKFNPKPYHYPSFHPYANDDVDLKLVGTCNGLLCLCDNNGGWTGGTITLVNPATDEELPLPPLPCGEVIGYDVRWKRWDEGYGFEYHPMTGRYKVVHTPCSFSWGWETNAVHVFTLGDKSWREVRPGHSMSMESCDLDAGIVSVDGATYWITKSSTTIVSFDLNDERVDSCCDMSLTTMLKESNDYNLTELHGRLGIVVRDRYGTTAWVGEARRKWSCRYSMACTWQDIPRPHFAYGDYFLKAKTSSMYVHRRRSTQWSSGGSDVVEISHRDRGMLIAGLEGGAYDYWSFAHVETMEPLDVYKAG